MVQDNKRANDLEAVCEALACWRRLEGGRGRPIPAALWSNAAEVARAIGVAETAHRLRLDPRKLARLAEGQAERAPRSVVEPVGFVELASVGLGEPPEPRRAVVELLGREGDRMRVELVGDASHAVDLAGLARAFWSRST